MPYIAGAFSWVVIVLLSVFTLRRFVMIVAAALPARVREPGPGPRVAVIASVLNEEEKPSRIVGSFRQARIPAREDQLHVGG